MTCRNCKVITDCYIPKDEKASPADFGGNGELLSKHSPGGNVKLQDSEVAMDLTCVILQSWIQGIRLSATDMPCVRGHIGVFSQIDLKDGLRLPLHERSSPVWLSTKNTQGWNSSEKLKGATINETHNILSNSLSWYTILFIWDKENTRSIWRISKTGGGKNKQTNTNSCKTLAETYSSRWIFYHRCLDLY